jgi:hypothetical protein
MRTFLKLWFTSWSTFFSCSFLVFNLRLHLSFIHIIYRNHLRSSSEKFVHVLMWEREFLVPRVFSIAVPENRVLLVPPEKLCPRSKLRVLGNYSGFVVFSRCFQASTPSFGARKIPSLLENVLQFPILCTDQRESGLLSKSVVQRQAIQPNAFEINIEKEGGLFIILSFLGLHS